jgi:hypothetical protein
VPISLDDATDSAHSDGEYDSELEPSVDTRIADDVNRPEGVDIDDDVDVETDVNHHKGAR